ENVTVIIASDHGFHYFKKYVNINPLLRTQGFLEESESLEVNVIEKCIKFLRRNKILMWSAKIFLSTSIQLKILAAVNNVNAKDWFRAKVFMPRGGIFASIFINDKVCLQSIQKKLLNY
ncbi:MAG: hypothetical protein PHG51_01855, partial [Candidatus Omnitrophica bacterium]|nr:hypothetical protein [Candidatus Omnitrophota bacterium]